MIESTLFTVLAGAAPVSVLVAARIFPMRRPQRDMTLPAIVYQRVGSSPDYTLAGDSGLDAVRIQVSCWASTYAGAKSLAAAVRTAVTGSASLSAITELELDDQDDATEEYRVILDFRIWQ